MGLTAVGRFNNSGGTAELAKLLAGREVIIVGENDEGLDGSWPGRDGAIKVARELASAWNKPVRWALPPTMTDGKDCRDFLIANRDRDPIEVGRELLSSLD
jgi:hypothetical protein